VRLIYFRRERKERMKKAKKTTVKMKGKKRKEKKAKGTNNLILDSRVGAACYSPSLLTNCFLFKLYPSRTSHQKPPLPFKRYPGSNFRL